MFDREREKEGYSLWLFLLSLVFALCFVLTGFAASSNSRIISAISWPLAGRLIVIDPGHGGIDPGAVGVMGIAEKDVALALSKKLQQELVRTGARVIITREGDDGLNDSLNYASAGKREDLSRRVQIANQNKADILISIHLNSFPSASEYGAQTFSQRGEVSSKQLSTCIQHELNRILKNSGREPIEGDYYITRHARMPAVIVEAGFLSNETEARLLTRPEYQSKVAYAISSGIAKYISEASKNVSSGAKV